MTTNPVTEKEVKPITALALILGTLVIVLGLGILVGYKFFWNTYDKDSKTEHDFKVAKAEVNADPNNVQARLALGWSFVQLGKFDNALEQFENALKLDPKNLVAKYNITLVKIGKKDLQGARVDLEAIKQENPKYFTARSTLGIVYRDLGEYKLSLQELELVNAMEPGNLTTLYQIGQTYEKLGEKQKAIEAYQQALKFNPNDQVVQKALAELDTK